MAARVDEHDQAANLTYINWCDYRLETRYQPDYRVNDEISWVIPAENLILHRRDRPSKGERENPVSGEIEEYIPMGETTLVTIRIRQAEDVLTMSVPSHVAQRNDLQRGGELSVSLLAEGIHLMVP